jgi:glycosyltransferase involved in cell wall biosynthesis
LKVALFANTGWYLYNFRRSLAADLRRAGYEVLLISPTDEYGEKLRELGFRWVAAPMNRRSVNPIREAVLIAWLCRLFWCERISLVHGFTIKSAVYGALAARLVRVRARINAVVGMGYVFTSQDLRAKCLRPILSIFFRLALGGKRARLVLQNTDDRRMFLQAGWVPAQRIRLIRGSGVDTKLFAPRSDAEMRDGQALRVALASRLLWDKGIGEAVAAIREARRRGIKIDFFIAGSIDEGNPNGIPQGILQSWVDEGLLHWLGQVKDVASLFRKVDVVILPTYYGEGLPKCLLEAAASGLAIVATDMPGCRELVTHEEDGLIVPPRDADALTSTIARLHDDQPLRARLGAAARAKVLAYFDSRLVNAQTIAMYRELIGSPPDQPLDVTPSFASSVPR